jgi:hypothetical protein
MHAAFIVMVKHEKLISGFPGVACLAKGFDCSFVCKQIPTKFEEMIERKIDTTIIPCWIFHRSIVGQIGIQEKGIGKVVRGPPHDESFFTSFSHVEHDWWVKIYCDLLNLCSLALLFESSFHWSEKISETINPNNDEYKLTINYALERQQRPIDFQHKENDIRDVMDQKKENYDGKTFSSSPLWNGIFRGSRGEKLVED